MKKINDTFGHRISNIALREFDRLVRNHTRKSDIFARYGGEEFIMLFPQTAREEAITEAERIRKAVIEHSFHTREANIRITFSTGIVFLPKDNIKNHDELIHRADAALFGAKNKGRNSVIVYPSKQLAPPLIW